jgi:hypothetical protein
VRFAWLQMGLTALLLMGATGCYIYSLVGKGNRQSARFHALYLLGYALALRVGMAVYLLMGMYQ